MPNKQVLRDLLNIHTSNIVFLTFYQISLSSMVHGWPYKGFQKNPPYTNSNYSSLEFSNQPKFNFNILVWAKVWTYLFIVHLASFTMSSIAQTKEENKIKQDWKEISIFQCPLRGSVMPLHWFPSLMSSLGLLIGALFVLYGILLGTHMCFMAPCNPPSSFSFFCVVCPLP